MSDLESLIDQAIKAVLGTVPSFIFRLDLVFEGITPQMTPLFSPSGTVIRLDLSSSRFFLFNGIDDQREELETFLYHELFHLRDRLSEEFELDIHKESIVEFSRVRKQINALWDISIERRKLDEFGIQSCFCFDYPPHDSREAVLSNLKALFPEKAQEAADAFTRIWDRNAGLVTWPTLVQLAGKLTN